MDLLSESIPSPSPHLPRHLRLSLYNRAFANYFFEAFGNGDIRKAIRSAGLGLNPQNDGKLIRIPVPPLTEERRKDMVKHLHKILEDHRTAIRNVRRDGNDAVKKAMKDIEKVIRSSVLG